MTKIEDTKAKKKILRFTTAGSVDDGKSTLIGRLLLDSKSIFSDQLEAIKRVSKKTSDSEINLALLTDGLKSEREQGITIDVAYRYFATSKRKFIIADTPGHIQYTRNMVTGASTADVALILIDARKGTTEQTLRHSCIASLLQIKHIIICINKMDLVAYNPETFKSIQKKFKSISSKLDVQNIHFIPISALKGDNVVEKSNKMNWYEGSTLLNLLENIDLNNNNLREARFPVQYVIRPQSNLFPDYRAYAGTVASGTFKVGDKILVLPSGLKSKIKSIIEFENLNLKSAFTSQSVSLILEDHIDISRGNMIVKQTSTPKISQDIDIMICWFNEKTLNIKEKYAIKHTSNDDRCIVKEVVSKININTLEKNMEDKHIGINDIAHIKIHCSKALHFDSYHKNKITGSVILIDESSNETLAAGMII